MSPQEDQTPLHIASRLGKTEIVQLLLQHMAHPDAATTNGYTPLHISAREGQLETASVLMEAGASHSLATKVRMGGGWGGGWWWQRRQMGWRRMLFSLHIVTIMKQSISFFGGSHEQVT